MILCMSLSLALSASERTRYGCFFIEVVPYICEGPHFENDLLDFSSTFFYFLKDASAYFVLEVVRSVKATHFPFLDWAPLS
jgi:hypothetical protein